MENISKTRTIGQYVRIFLIFITIIILLVSLIGSYITSQSLLNNRNLLNQQGAATSLMSQEKSINTSITNTLQQFPNEAAFSGQSYDKNQVKQLLKIVKESNSQIKGIGFKIANSKLIKTGTIDEKSNSSTLSWYKNALSSPGEVVWTEPYKEKGSKQMVRAASLLVKNMSGQQGVLVINVSYQSIKNSISSLKIGRTGSATLVHENGIVITSSGKSKNYTFKSGQSIGQKKIFQRIKNATGNRGILKISGTHGGKVYYDKGQTGDHSVWSFAIVDHNDLNTELHALILVSGIIALTMIVIIWLFSSYLIRILRSLAEVFNKHFKEASHGNFKKIRSPKGTAYFKLLKDPQKMALKISKADKNGQEFNQIAYNYNKMVDALGIMVGKVQNSSKTVTGKSDSLLEISQQTNKAIGEVTQLQELLKLQLHKHKKHRIALIN
ncbi:PDC sensor domain-containing protein [Liquorilactobacillus sicerae]|uniref:PDC sensor domain-containing protein n=1 Tax=Liquorilactobacillus sicerae TaxID=1416943 RepID=UPI00247FCED2|nr:cache domain-containing protein [Liquorilactobacillus sicerae]